MNTYWTGRRITLWTVAALLLTGALIFGVATGCKSWNRYQRRADANNAVQVTAIQIRNYQQRVKIAHQQAQIRLQTAIGVRHAQDEIASTLTPLYVQFEMIDALKTIAASGRNNSVVYIPAGANGVPLVSVSGQPQVYAGDQAAGKK